MEEKEDKRELSKEGGVCIVRFGDLRGDADNLLAAKRDGDPFGDGDVD